MHDAFSARQFVTLAGTLDAWAGVVQEPNGTLSLIQGGSSGHRACLADLRNVRCLALSRDGSALAAFIDDDGDERGNVLAWSGDSAWHEASAPGGSLAVHELAISHSGTRLAVLAATGDGFEVLVGAAESDHALRSVLRHHGDLRGLALSDDGRFLAVAARSAAAAARWELRFVALDDSTEQSVHAAPDDLFPCAVLASPEPIILVSTQAAEGMGAALWRPRDKGFERLALQAQPDATWDLCDVSSDGRVLAIRWQGGESSLVTLARDGGDIVVAPICGAIGGARWISASRVTALWSDIGTPLTLTTFDAQTGQRVAALQPLSPLSDLDGVLATSATLTASDGLTFQCWSFSKDSSEAPRAVIIDIHGGPDEIVTNQYLPERHSWLAAGYAVICPNYRGSAGFGKLFAKAGVGNPGHAELRDISATIAHARERFGAAVPIVLSGWSYGGFLALLHAIRHPGAACAVLAGNPVLDWTAQHELAPPHLRRLQETLFGADLEATVRQELYRERSPLTHARSLRLPTLILFAATDVRCPASAVEALRREAEAARLPIHFHECAGGHLSAEFDSEARREIFHAGLEFVEALLRSSTP